MATDKIIDKSSNETVCSTENVNKAKVRARGKKRKRAINSDDSSDFEEILPDNALAIEKSVHASAVKNNLDETSVRKILKKVVSNDHVLALVKLREEEEEDSGTEDSSLRPKLTRAKVKELMKVSPTVTRKSKEAWNLENLELTPIKHIPVKTRPEVKALIAQELPEDEDDDEYEPTHEDVPSDDDQGLESSSDLESQPRTPATPKSLPAASPKVVKDGPFKVPQEVSTPSTRRKLDLEEEATIALRTRSKLSLSSTSIEHIESTFVPPDDIPMPAVDNLWNEFLSECLNPVSTSKHEDDDEADPEYNVAADPDANDEDEEKLGNSIIKISKKELSDLMTELFNIMPETVAEDDLMVDNLANSVLTDQSQIEIPTRWEGKQEPTSDEERRENMSDRIMFEKRGYSKLSIGKCEPQQVPEQEVAEDEGRNESTQVNTTADVINTPRVVDIQIEERDEAECSSDLQRAPPLLRRHLKQTKAELVTIHVDDGVKMLPEQVLLLQQQIRQHVQLATSNYLQLYVHPIHWKMAATFKEYLETLLQLGDASPKSVVNVCNLRPAIELVHMWETTVSADTPENKEMVQFMLDQSERCRRRFSKKSLYVGEFHEVFQKTVANSPVFLYPYLLPSMPYRADFTKKYAYTRSEDELIVLGLDQFWDYVEKNPAIYRAPAVSNPRQRWGLVVTVQLVVKHMFPWTTNKILMGHIQFVRRSNDPDNPICKFFRDRTVTPFKHKLLSFNPNLTLYEHPEHEVPKIWVRYLAKTSKRFRNFLLRRTGTTGTAPQGVEVQLGQPLTNPIKAPLPIDFTKKIVSNRINLHPKVPIPALSDKFDVVIVPTTTPPVSLYKLVETSTGGFLMPVTDVTTVNSNNTPICSTAEVVSNIIENNLPESSRSVETDKNVNTEHCSCCILLRKICKQRQMTIKDYFSKNKPNKSCYCKDIKYPRVSNRLKLLVSNMKTSYKDALQLLSEKLKIMKSNKYRKDKIENEKNCNEPDWDDFVYVTTFHLKLLTRSTVARDTLIKRRVHTIFKKFNPFTDDPLVLTSALYDAFSVELVDVYKDFLCFLTPEQADKCDAFKDYFIRNCIQDLVMKIEAEVSTDDRIKILEKLQLLFYNNLMTACEICTDLLSSLQKYPALAQYVFKLFPHKKQNKFPVKGSPKKRTKDDAQTQGSPHKFADETLRDQSQAAMDYEADHSSSEDEEEYTNKNNSSGDEDDSNNPHTIKNEITTSDNETGPDNIVRDTCRSNTQNYSSDSSNSMLIVCEESVKSEAAEWKREEDKLILELLKEHLTPEERKGKTILEIIVEKNLIDMITENLIHKSKMDVTSRILYLLQVLVLSEK